MNGLLKSLHNKPEKHKLQTFFFRRRGKEGKVVCLTRFNFVLYRIMCLG